MHRSTLLPLLALLPLHPFAQSPSPKRGLVHIPSASHPSDDDQIWLTGLSPPTWYYNYSPHPSAAYTGHASLHFVPMLWGASPTDTGTPFYTTITHALAAGANIPHVLSFNEPDGTHATGAPSGWAWLEKWFACV